jgi:hypothetical protein
MEAAIPDHVTHYYMASRPPFLNLSDLSEKALDPVMEHLAFERQSGQSSRVFGRRYMELRRLTEQKLRRLFVEAGGTPLRESPHYFVLGSSCWYQGLAKDTKQVTLDLVELPEDATSITIPDSVTAMGLGETFGLHVDAKPHHGKVYRLSELKEVVERYGMPVDEKVSNYDGYHHGPFEKYIEVQLWADGPVARFLEA